MKYTPEDAVWLMRSDRIIHFACDLATNPAFSRADARTRDAHGKRIADYTNAATWPGEVRRLLAFQVAEFEVALDLEPVRQSRIPKALGGERALGVPTSLRRCLSNVINRVLSLTGDRLLPGLVRAYRPSKEDAVQAAILDVAEAVRLGDVRYFAKLDFASYFSAIPWAVVERALEHYGYPKSFIGYVMALVRCKVVERRGARLVPVPNYRGLQQGLPEASTLANMVPYELDARLAALPLVVVRYCDDVFIGGQRHGDVLHAVRLVSTWCSENKIDLKGVPQAMARKRLVKDVCREKVQLLGAEIDTTGYVHMPRAKLTSKLDQLTGMFERLVRGNVAGTSRYGDGGGVDAFDSDDLRGAMQAFLDYWERLDPRATARTRTIFRKRFPLTPDLMDLGRGTVWTARLWRLQTERRTGTSPAIQTPAAPPSDEETRNISSRGFTNPGTEHPVEEDPVQDGVASEPEPSPNPQMDADSIDGFLEADDMDNMLVDDEPFYTVTGVEDGSVPPLHEVAHVHGADVRMYNRFPSRPEPFEDSASGDSGSGASPSAPSFANGVTFRIHTESVQLGGRRQVIVGVLTSSEGRVVRTTIARYVHRPEAAVLREILRCVHLGAVVPVVFTMPETWLVKGLLQPSRRFRAPLLFRLILHLHRTVRELNANVRIVGGVRPPPALRRAVALAVERAEAEAA